MMRSAAHWSIALISSIRSLSFSHSPPEPSDPASVEYTEEIDSPISGFAIGPVKGAPRTFFYWELAMDGQSEEISVTKLLRQWGEGSKEALDQLTSLVHSDLRQ